MQACEISFKKKKKKKTTRQPGAVTRKGELDRRQQGELPHRRPLHHPLSPAPSLRCLCSLRVVGLLRGFFPFPSCRFWPTEGRQLSQAEAGLDCWRGGSGLIRLEVRRCLPFLLPCSLLAAACAFCRLCSPTPAAAASFVRRLARRPRGLSSTVRLHSRVTHAGT
jgi:hypothetical protein